MSMQKEREREGNKTCKRERKTHGERRMIITLYKLIHNIK